MSNLVLSLLGWTVKVNTEKYSNRSSGQLPPTCTIFLPSKTDVTDITTGSAHTIALRKDGSVWVWGNNFNGQIGDGTKSSGGTGKDRLAPYPLEKWTIAGFYDVLNTNPYATYIGDLRKRGVTNGNRDGNFDPSDQLTRAQFATFMVRAFKLPTSNGPNAFSDT